MIDQDETNIITQLNDEVVMRIKPSKIHGVGVFAIQDIPKGKSLVCASQEHIRVSVAEMSKLHPEVINMICAYHLISGFDAYFRHPNSTAHLVCFMNHADNPNSTGYTALRDIKAGEEVTEDYNNGWNSWNPQLDEHYTFLKRKGVR